MNLDIISVKNKIILTILVIFMLIHSSGCNHQNPKGINTHYETKEIFCDELTEEHSWLGTPYGNSVAYVCNHSYMIGNGSESKFNNEYYRLLNLNNLSVSSIYPTLEESEYLGTILAFDENTYLFTTMFTNDEKQALSYRVIYQNNEGRKILFEHDYYSGGPPGFEVLGTDVYTVLIYNKINDDKISGILGNELWKITPEGETECLDHREFEYENYQADNKFIEEYARKVAYSTPDKICFVTKTNKVFTLNILEEDKSITKYTFDKVIGHNIVALGDEFLMDNVDVYSEFNTKDNPGNTKIYNPKTREYRDIKYLDMDMKMIIDSSFALSHGYAFVLPRDGYYLGKKTFMFKNNEDEIIVDDILREDVPVNCIRRINASSILVDGYDSTGKHRFHVFSIVEDE